MARRKNLTNMVFERLTVLQDSGERTKNRGVLWKCRCSCGTITKVSTTSLIRGNTKSCGCLNGSYHGLSRDVTYKAWYDMHYRCTNKNRSDYKDYGGRKIKVCERWKFFEKFLKDMGPRPKNMTLDRIDNDGDYEPNNCRWTSRTTQNGNKRRSRKAKEYYWNKQQQKWHVLIMINGKSKHFGFFDEEEKAKQKAERVRKKYPLTTNK